MRLPPAVVRRTQGFGTIRGLRVGHAESDDGSTGVTAVLFDEAAPTVVAARGGACATYDTSSLALDATFGRRWAVFFAGGSLYGLDAARGIRTRILETGGGHSAFGNPNRVVPISGAALFDLPMRGRSAPDFQPIGYEAARRARTGSVPSGSVGAGAGATVGKYLGRERAMRGGIGSASGRFGRGKVGVLVALNAVGAIRDPASGAWVAGATGPRGSILPPSASRRGRSAGRGTTLVLLATDLDVDRPALARATAIVETGLASAVVPFHTSTDGDVVFAAATGRAGPPAASSRPGELADRLGVLGAELAVDAVLAVARASRRSV